MASLPKKKDQVQKIKRDLSQVAVLLVLDYRGLSVAEVSSIRRQLRQNDAQLTVVKNTLMRRAIQGTELEPMAHLFKGPTAIAIGRKDQVVPAKILKEFLKKNKKENEIRGGFLEGKPLNAQEVGELADLPSIDELRGKLLGCINSPLAGLVGALSSQQRSLVYVLDQIAQQKQQAS